MGLKNSISLLMGGLMTILGCLTVVAAQSNSKLKVGISPFSPFVILAEGEPTGVSIDFWHQIALKLNMEKQR